jgi:hypothetical protein
MKRHVPCLIVLLSAAPAAAQERSRIRSFVEERCLDCHDGDGAKGGLDLSRLGLDLGDRKTFATWVKVHDRVARGEMPPGKAARPPKAEVAAFLAAVADPLVATDLARDAVEGRATRRRLNRYEYENTLRDLFQAPWLQVKDILPEDGEAFRFNKVGDALDVSHVQIAQYLAAAEYAMREVLSAEVDRPAPATTRYQARDMRSFTGLVWRKPHGGHVRNSFRVVDPATGEAEGIGFVHGTYEPVEPRFDRFHAPRAGRYRLRISARSVWVGAQQGPQWWAPDFERVSRGRRPEPVTLYAERPPTLLRRLGAFDAGPDAPTAELDVYLLAGETIRPDAARLFRSRPARSEGRPPGSAFHNPLATREGQPGVLYRWLEVEGPLADESSTAGRTLLFDELPVRALGKGRFEVTSPDPRGDARRLMDAFVRRAYRRPVAADETDRFVAGVLRALDDGVPFAEAMMAGYTAVLCSPPFVYLEEAPGPLDDRALAARLSYFLWNSPPDERLHAAAARGDLHRPAVLRGEAERLLDDPRARRFTDAFLDYWLDLRRASATSPDAVLYPDYNLDDLLVESATQETQLYFAELLRKDLPARNVIDSDFAMVNERLATLYGLPPPRSAPLGVALRRVSLPRGSLRGGLLTQASVLKVTANGTTTSPVIRGAWISERLLGVEIPPPPPGVPAIEPDIRGARTIREQLDKHRADRTCAGCHARFDPVGLALEGFDVFGGRRSRYRAMGDGPTLSEHFGKDGIRHEFHDGLPVDTTGALAGGARFRDVADLRRILLRDERQIARNLLRQLTVYATGAPVRFGDRPRIEELLDHAAPRRFGVRTLVLSLVDSPLFRNK